MEIETEIIMALNEPKNFQKLYLATKNVRKKRGLGLGRTDFNNALKRLREEKIIIEKEIGRREKEFRIDNEDRGSMILKILGEEDAKLDRIEEFVISVDAQVEFLNNNNILKRKQIIKKSQKVILDYINIILSRHKYLSFIAGSAWAFPSIKRELAYQIKRCGDLKNRLSYASKNLDIHTSGNVFLAISNEIRKEVDDRVDRAKKSSEYFQS